jgi:DNA-binding NtrC family response regulator
MTNFKAFKLLVIGEDPQSLGAMVEGLLKEGIEVFSTKDLLHGFEIFLECQPRNVLIDIAGSEAGGMYLLDRLIGSDPATNVILVSQSDSPDTAMDAIRRGACDFLTKPVDFQTLARRIAYLAADAEVRRKTLALDNELVQTCQFQGIIGRSLAMLDVFSKIRRVAPHFKTALITGATGTGKELVAKALYDLSPVFERPFVVCNCAALVESLVESELFGYVKGAFTGAIQNKPGLFESADRGVIFLDEIGELSLGAQAKLLRVLQDHRVRRVGAAVSREINIRVIAATNRDLRSMVREGKFRDDLYYRLAIVEIALPPLVDRLEDIPLLYRFFVDKFSKQYKKPISGLTRRAQKELASYFWPGNIRELENVIENACMMAQSRFIDINDLPERVRIRQTEPVRDERFFSLEEIQRRHVMRVINHVGGNKTRAAEILGIGRATIYEMLSKIRLEKNPEAS